ncbi:phosphoglycerate dehydrogenase [Succinimonas sp.]|uniref:phosphoglycerate dehydrogenase n=1 Tax=Succinimonas sp. TaxID=1936151 RepID=UPI00386F589B|nr:phosphoglycerate dehydrogenase [Succinimonas sp.]
MARYSLDKNKIKILLLEGVSESALEVFKKAGYTNVEYLKGALGHDELIEKIKDVHFIGIRSRTHLTEDVFEAAHKLCAVGCFCIGTNQVDLDAARAHGIPVFNAPFSNTRSVAEMVTGEYLTLMRTIPEKNAILHRGGWNKSAKGSYEVRGKTLGIIGYGHIGTQVGIIAEALGLKVEFYDIENKLDFGNVRQVETLDELYAHADIITLHVPDNPTTRKMINAESFSKMKNGVIFINAARGSVVDIDALVDALKSGKVGGAAVDVYPTEPAKNGDPFESPLTQFDNVILTPHIGGSTKEAQTNIGIEVATKLATYSDNGSTLSAVNFPEVSLPVQGNVSRLLHVHKNVPGILKQLNQIMAERNIGVASQYLQTLPDVGYVVMDVVTDDAEEILQEFKKIPGTLKARILL